MYREDSLTSQLVATFGAAAGGYLLESWQKAANGSPWPVAAEGGTLVGSAIARRLTRHPILNETAEAMQYGSAWGLGRWAADITTTIGGKAPGAAPPWMPGSTSSSGYEAPPNPGIPTDLVQPLIPNSPVTESYRYNRRRVAY